MEKVKKKKKSICRVLPSIFKHLYMLIILLAIIYGLVYVPTKQLQIAENQVNLNLKKVDRSCRILTDTNIQAAVANSKENGEEVTEENIKKASDNMYSNCIFAEGFDMVNKE